MTPQTAMDRAQERVRAHARCAVPQLIKAGAREWNPVLHWWRLFPGHDWAPADRRMRVAMIETAIVGEKYRAAGGAGSGFAPYSANRMIGLKSALLAERLAAARYRAMAKQMEAAE